MYTLEDLQAAIAIFSNVDVSDPDIDQIDELIINAANKVVAVDKILDAHEAGEIELEYAHVAIAEIITESAEADLDVFDLEIDLEQVEEGYSNPNDETISFSQALGGTISNLIEREYANPVEGIKAIASVTGLDNSQINQIITGELVPETETANSIAACFSATSDGQGYQEFMGLSKNALDEVVQFSSPDPQIVPVADPVTNGDLPLLNQVQRASSIKNKVDKLEAEFSAIAQQKELGDALRVLKKDADVLVSNGQMTPHEKTILFGKYEDDSDSLALFTAACAANNTPVATQVDRIRYTIDMAKQRNADARFSSDRHDDYIVEVNDDDFTNEYVSRNGII